jgi:hypothetical protein
LLGHGLASVVKRKPAHRLQPAGGRVASIGFGRLRRPVPFLFAIGTEAGVIGHLKQNDVDGRVGLAVRDRHSDAQGGGNGRYVREDRRNYYLEDTVEEGNFISRERLLSCARRGDIIVSFDRLFLGLDWGRVSELEPLGRC